jgi:protein O-GlcNAc transferase
VLKRLLRALRRGAAADIDPRAAAEANRLFDQALRWFHDGDPDRAKAHCARALALDARSPGAWNLLGRIALDRGDLENAAQYYQRASEGDPTNPVHMVFAAEASRQAGRLARALELSAQALVLAPEDSRAWQVRGNTMEELGQLEEAVQCLGRELELRPDDARVGSNLLNLQNRTGLLPPVRVAAEHRAWAQRHADPLTAAAAAHENSPDPERLLRIGYVSADFRRHAMAYSIEPVLRHHRRGRFTVYCYYNWPRSDEMTEQLKPLSDYWREIAGLDDDAVARLVRDDRIDVLVDLSGHTLGHRLGVFARKPAPVQITYLGYPGTTGMAAMDYRLTDAHVDPEGAADTHYRERLLRLPHGLACYQPPAEAPDVNALPALERGYVTFGSFNYYQKLSAETLRAWARMLSKLPTSRLRIVGVPPGEAFERVLDIFEEEGVYADRVDAIPRQPLRSYFEQYLQVDLALDAYPFTGGTTTLESLWMGIPVVSLVGDAGMSRRSASHLADVGLSDLVAGSWDQYVRVGLDLATDLSRLAQLRASLRGRMRATPIIDGERFTIALEDRYRYAWGEWCAQSGGRHA